MVRVYSTLTSWGQVKRACNRYFYNVLKVLALSAQGWPGACFSNKHAKPEKKMLTRGVECDRARSMQVSLHGHMVMVTVPGLAK